MKYRRLIITSSARSLKRQSILAANLSPTTRLTNSRRQESYQSLVTTGRELLAGTGAERRYGLAAHREGAAEVRLKPTESIAGAEGRLAIASPPLYWHCRCQFRGFGERSTAFGD